MTQPQRGSARSEVHDLRNIVDRLDLLMGSATSTSGATDARSGIDRTVTELVDRVGVLEDQVEELRTLVNHLMTIATWQAKVTAQLVDDEVGDESEEPYADDAGTAPYPDAVAARRPADDPAPRRGMEAPPDDDPPPPRFALRRDEPPRRQQSGRTQRTTTLDEDIDDILGVDRGHTSDRGSGPPDFGI